MAEPYYTTAANLNTELDTTLDGARAVALIQDAEDLIDELLGFWPIDEDTGRKIVEDQVEAWQWEKLGRATLKLAAKLYRQPELVDGLQYKSISGPDFSFSGPVGSALGRQIIGLLNDSDLRRLTGRAKSDRNSSGNSLLTEKFFNTGQPRSSTRW